MFEEAGFEHGYFGSDCCTMIAGVRLFLVTELDSLAFYFLVVTTCTKNREQYKRGSQRPILKKFMMVTTISTLLNPGRTQELFPTILIVLDPQSGNIILLN